MSTISGAEEIEELRAKAIASMTSAPNPSTAVSSKSPKSKEEGEIPTAEDAVVLPACSTALPNVTMLEEHRPNVVVDSHPKANQDFPTVKSLSNAPVMGNAHSRSSVTRKYSKQFKKVQGPLKPTSNHSLSWHGKGSDDNLVISFSDDDSGSDSEESKVEKNIGRKDIVAKVNRSEVLTASTPVSSRGLQGEANRTNLAVRKGFTQPASILSDMKTRLTGSRHLRISAEKDAQIPRHNPSTKISARLEHDLVPDPNVSDHKLATLRHEIALRENELKVPSKLSNEKHLGLYNDTYSSHAMLPETKAGTIKRSASVAGIGSAPKEQIMKRLKPAVGAVNKQTSPGLLQLPIFSRTSDRQCNLQLVEKSNSLSKGDVVDFHVDNIEKRQCAAEIINPVLSVPLPKVNDSALAPVHVTMCSTHVVSSKVGGHGEWVADVSQSCDMPETNNMPANHLIIDGQMPCLLQSNPSTEEGLLHDGNVSSHKNLSKEHATYSDMSRGVDSSSLLPSKVHGRRSTARTHQIEATTAEEVPLETSSHLTERLLGCVEESNLGNDGNTSHLNYSNRIMSGEERMNLESLMDLEELQDKELEAAQELRRMCELEERRALKAYRKAQRTLVDANEKCSLLYRKRELFSAQLRSLLMQASSSIWPSGWQSQGGTASESLETVPDASFDLLSSMGDELPDDCQILGQLAHESHSVRSMDAHAGTSSRQINAHDLVSTQCLEQNASKSYDRDSNALAGVSDVIRLPGRCTDKEENYPTEHMGLEYKLTWNTAEESHDQTTAGANGPERLSSDENAQDYELLEASLRSKLVERLSSKTLYKGHTISEAECFTQGQADEVGDTTKSLLPNQQMEGHQTEPLELEGVERLGRSINLDTSDNHSHDNGVSLIEEANRICDSQDNNFFHIESFRPNQTTDSTLPSSVLHVAFEHAKCTLRDCFGELSTTRETEVLTHKEFGECMPDGERSSLYGMRFARIREIEPRSFDLAIDPFWPFCMFELRGKCNNEECQLQHTRRHSLRKLQHDEISATSCSDGQASQLPSGRRYDDYSGPPYGLLYHSLSIPTYHIGFNLIRVDSYLSFSVLARSIWQHWQRVFHASFSLPFSVQRILPMDAPFLQTGDGPVADDYNWNRLSLHHQTLDGSMNQIVHGLPGSEQSLEMALDLFYGSICKPDRKKVLSMLSRAIEVNPSSVAVWIIYLHIYYARETDIGKDDLFFHAVNRNKGSYELWLMYINSRMRLNDRLDAYEHALTTFCHNGNSLEKDRGYISACILDIFLQMIDFLCMSGNAQKAIQKIVGLFGNSANTLVLDIRSCLIVSDKCIFWFCCIYLAIYRKLPELIAEKLEFEKELPFELEWPSIELTTEQKELALGLMKLAVSDMDLAMDTNPLRKDDVALRSLHFLAVSHIRCVVVLEGLSRSADLLATYLSLYPTCIELALMSARMKEDNTDDLIFKSLEELLSNWPKGTSGVQCLWNQYVERALAEKKTDIAEFLLDRWFKLFFEGTNLINEGDNGAKQDDIFWFLNLSLCKTLQKDTREAQIAIDKALKLASTHDYKHCVQEHVALSFAKEVGTERRKHFNVIFGLLHGYLADSRSATMLEPLSRRYFRCIKRPRLQQLLTNILGPVSRDFTLLNSALEACYGTCLLPEILDDQKAFVDFVESLMEIMPANYRLALSVCKLTTNFCNPSVPTDAVKFWACSLMVNSIFDCVPVAPEHVWVEAANILGNSKFPDISMRFHLQSLSVYPFSIELWQSYLGIWANTDRVYRIIETARERGIELNRPVG